MIGRAQNTRQNFSVLYTTKPNASDLLGNWSIEWLEPVEPCFDGSEPPKWDWDITGIVHLEGRNGPPLFRLTVTWRIHDDLLNENFNEMKDFSAETVVVFRMNTLQLLNVKDDDPNLLSTSGVVGYTLNTAVVERLFQKPAL